MKLKNYLGLTLITASLSFLAYSCDEADKGETEDKTISEEEKVKEQDGNEEKHKAESPRKEAVGVIDGVNIAIDYGSPSVRGRMIWGGLEDYDAVWRAGANETTSMEFSQDLLINGQKLPAGKYGFFIIPKETGPWIAIFNKSWSRKEHNAWGAYNYDPSKDVLRLNIEPTWSDTVQEDLVYEVNADHIHFAWDKVQLNMSVSSAE